MSNTAHNRPSDEELRAQAAAAAMAEQGQPMYQPVPAPAFVYPNEELATDPAGNAFVLLVINTPHVPNMPIVIDQAQARRLGAKLQELGSKKAIQIAQAMPEGLILPGQG